MRTQDAELIKTFRTLLAERNFKNQGEMVEALKLHGYHDVSQSKISRILNNIGAVRTRNAKRESVYCVQEDVSVPAINAPLSSLVNDIDYNDSVIVIKTTPGAAQIVARLMDSLSKADGVLGSVGGDDTIFVTPTRHTNVEKLYQTICAVLAI